MKSIIASSLILFRLMGKKNLVTMNVYSAGNSKGFTILIMPDIQAFLDMLHSRFYIPVGLLNLIMCCSLL